MAKKKQPSLASLHSTSFYQDNTEDINVVSNSTTHVEQASQQSSGPHEEINSEDAVNKSTGYVEQASPQSSSKHQEGNATEVPSGKRRILNRDPKDPTRYANVTADSLAVFKAEQAALEKKSGNAGLLLNKIIDCLFSVKELANAKGQGIRQKKKQCNANDQRRPLDMEKVSAIREYIRTLTVKHKWTQLDNKEFNERITNKCTNARAKTRPMKLK